MLAVHKIVDGDSLSLHRVTPGWTMDSNWLLFTAGPGSTVWKIHRDQGESIPVTDHENTIWILGGHTPTGLADGRIAYFQGLIPGDFGMHIMAADTSQVSGEPSAEILYRFAGTPVGLASNQISSPNALSLDGLAHRAMATWTSTWFLEWSQESEEPLLISRPVIGLEDASSFRIGSTGEFVVYVDGDNIVHWMGFDAEETHPLSAGTHPSMATADTTIGFAAPNGVDYVKYDRSSGRSTVYAGRPDLKILFPVLSPDGRWVAFLGELEGVASLYLGQFLN